MNRDFNERGLWFVEKISRYKKEEWNMKIVKKVIYNFRRIRMAIYYKNNT